jgi:hypothetical protein
MPAESDRLSNSFTTHKLQNCKLFQELRNGSQKAKNSENAFFGILTDICLFETHQNQYHPAKTPFHTLLP